MFREDAGSPSSPEGVVSENGGPAPSALRTYEDFLQAGMGEAMVSFPFANATVSVLALYGKHPGAQPHMARLSLAPDNTDARQTLEMMGFRNTPRGWEGCVTSALDRQFGDPAVVELQTIMRKKIPAAAQKNDLPGYRQYLPC